MPVSFCDLHANSSKRALSFPLVPVRRLMARHLASASMSSAGFDRTSGTWRLRGRLRLGTGQIIFTSAGYALRRRGIPTAQVNLRAERRRNGALIP